jgi:hypothetical protein
VIFDTGENLVIGVNVLMTGSHEHASTDTERKIRNDCRTTLLQVKNVEWSKKVRIFRIVNAKYTVKFSVVKFSVRHVVPKSLAAAAPRVLRAVGF